MRSILSPAAAMALLTFCTPANERKIGETRLADTATGASSVAQPAAANAVASTTPAILSQMNVANTIEIQLSRMAEKKAASPEVREIANQLAVDHSRNREQVRALGRRLRAPVTPAVGGDVSAADSVAMPADLQGKSGAELDRAFVQREIEDHESNLEKVQEQMLPAAQDVRVKAYLQKTFTEMQGHLASLKAVQQELGS